MILQLKKYSSYCSIYSLLYFSDLGAHIDGFIAVVAHTLVIGASKVRVAMVF